MEMKPYIIVGAGRNGIELLQRLGAENVSFFADNNEKMIGSEIKGIRVIPVNDLPELSDSNTIVVAIESKASIIDQLYRLGIDHFVVYASERRKEYLRRNILGGLSKQEQIINDKLEEYSRQSDIIDPVNNIEEFRELVIKCKNDKELIEYYKDVCFNIVGMDWESRTYGHLSALLNYAELNDADPGVFPVIPHAPFAFDNFTSYSTATAFSSRFLRDESNKNYPYVPAFVIGEYMQYVNRQEQVIKKDQKNNRSVIVFMHHSIEFIKVQHEYDCLMRDVFEPLLRDYSEVYLSVYWYDLDDELYKLLSAAGIKLVSAGFRFDERFIYRLAEVIDMCDDVVVIGRTSALIYALARGKRLFYYEENNTKISYALTSSYNSRVKIPEREKQMLIWEMVLLENKGKRLSEYSEKDKKILDYYFGLLTHRTKEDLRMLHEIGKEIWENSDYTEELYPMAVYRTYWKYQNEGDFRKLALLSEALPARFWNL